MRDIKNLQYPVQFIGDSRFVFTLGLNRRGEVCLFVDNPDGEPGAGIPTKNEFFFKAPTPQAMDVILRAYCRDLERIHLELHELRGKEVVLDHQ